MRGSLGSCRGMTDDQKMELSPGPRAVQCWSVGSHPLDGTGGATVSVLTEMGKIKEEHFPVSEDGVEKGGLKIGSQYKEYAYVRIDTHHGANRVLLGRKAIENICSLKDEILSAMDEAEGNSFFLAVGEISVDVKPKEENDDE